MAKSGITPSMPFNETALVAAMDAHDITHPTERAMFLAQMKHETGGFVYQEEIHDGSNYEGRADLGNTQPGDGMEFKGRGFIQLTGRANYEHYGKVIGEDLVGKPELAKDPAIAAKVALAYWDERVPKEAAQAGDVEAVTRAINGGTNGLSERADYFDEYKDSATIAIASTGLVLPFDLSAVASDLSGKSEHEALVTSLRDIEEDYANRTIPDGKVEHVQQVLRELQEVAKQTLENAQGVEFSSENMMLAMHLGPDSAVTMLQSQNADMVSDLAINKESLASYMGELKQAGIIEGEQTLDGVNIATFKQWNEAFYDAQQNKSVALTRQVQSGAKLSESDSRDVSFFEQLSGGLMGGEMGGMFEFLISLVSMLAMVDDSFEEKGREQGIESPPFLPPKAAPDASVDIPPSNIAQTSDTTLASVSPAIASEAMAAVSSLNLPVGIAFNPTEVASEESAQLSSQQLVERPQARVLDMA